MKTKPKICNIDPKMIEKLNKALSVGYNMPKSSKPLRLEPLPKWILTPMRIRIRGKCNYNKNTKNRCKNIVVNIFPVYEDEEIDKSQIYCEQHAPHLADIDSGIVRDGTTYLNFWKNSPKRKRSIKSWQV